MHCSTDKMVFNKVYKAQWDKTAHILGVRNALFSKPGLETVQCREWYLMLMQLVQ